MNSLLYLTFGLLTRNTPFDAILASNSISLPEKKINENVSLINAFNITFFNYNKYMTHTARYII
jgi:hypothetical protein